jgi:hypothetical protein
MASATLKLTIDPATGKRTVTISYASDEDALPHEHEEAHRALVEKIFEQGIVEREEAPPTTTAGAGDAREEARGNSRAGARGSG